MSVNPQKHRSVNSKSGSSDSGKTHLLHVPGFLSREMKKFVTRQRGTKLNVLTCGKSFRLRYSKILADA